MGEIDLYKDYIKLKKNMHPNKLLNFFYKKKIRFFSGVPDHCTSQLAKALQVFKKKEFTHIIAPNEGTAVSLGVGHYLSTSQIPCIYMQNSGFGNATDPITNLCHERVYNIPLLILIGWRGKPGQKDEPQHITQGKTICDTLKSYGIKFYDSKKINLKKMEKIIDETKRKNLISAILIDRNYFEKTIDKTKNSLKNISRSDAIRYLLKNVKPAYKIISSTGFNSREILRQDKKNKAKSFFLVGGMGHTLAVALGILQNKKKAIVCVDGDGSFYMHMGSFSLIKKSTKLIYYLLDNSSHETVGDVKLNYKIKDIKNFVKSVGFKKYIKVNDLTNLDKCLRNINMANLPIFIHVITRIEHNKNLPRPSKNTLIKVKNYFLKS